MTITSKEVAEMLGKRHDNLLRAIRKYITQLGDEAPKYFSDEVKHLMDVSLKQKAYIENLEAELNECKMLNNQLMSDLDADEGLAEICVNEFIADTIKAVKDAGVKKITVEF